MIVRRLKWLLHILACLYVMSCSKINSVPSTNGSSPISLTVVADKTKTLVSGSILPDSYTIYASTYFTSYTAPEANGNYFVALPFNNNGSVWTTNPVVYWPIAGKLDMIAVACEKDSLDVNKYVVWHEGNCSEGLEIKLKDGDCMHSEILFAAAYERTANESSIPLQFKHSQSWLQFIINCNTEVLRIDKIVLENVYSGGLFRVSNNVYMDAEWLFRGYRKTNIIVPGSESVIPQAGTPIICNMLLPEQDACDIAIYYSTKSSTTKDWSAANSTIYRYKAGTNPWYYGEKNVYKINFDFTEISLTSSVNSWDNTSTDININ